MARPRVRVRGLMILVAAVALLIGGEQMRRRRVYCLKMADQHRSQLYMISGFHFSIPRSSLTAEKEEELRRTYPHAAWHLDLSDAYRQRASRPWEPVPPEPPEPSDFPAPPGQDQSHASEMLAPPCPGA
jgi:hypothetical protein